MMPACTRFVFLISVPSWIFLSGCSESTWTKQKIAESQQRGDAIVSAIEVFKENNSRLPTDIADLPDGTVQSPVAGTGKWTYLVDHEKGKFVLMFETDDEYPACYYDSKVGYWIEDR